MNDINNHADTISNQDSSLNRQDERISPEDYTKAELIEKIKNLIEENNKNSIIIIQQQKYIKNLEILAFSGKVRKPAQTKALPQKEKVVKVISHSQLATSSAPNKLKRILSLSMQKTILFGGKFIKNAIIKKKLKKLSKNPYAYFADSKCKYLRPLRNLFERP